MSSRYDLVIVCDLREDTQSSCIDLIQWLSNSASDLATRPQLDFLDETWKVLEDSFDYPFLVPLPEEEIISVFQRKYRYAMAITAGGRDVYRYALQFSARSIVSEYFFKCYLFVHWLATLAEDGFIGYYKAEYRNQPTLLYVKDQKIEER